MDDASTRGTVKSDTTLFAILDALVKFDDAGVTEIANEVGVAKGTAHKHLKTLEGHHYVVRGEEGYNLSHKFLKYGVNVIDYRLCNHVRPRVMQLSERVGEMVIFSVMEADYGAFAFTSAMTENRTNYLTAVMTEEDNGVPFSWRFPLHQLGVGKAILSELPDEEIRDLLGRTGTDGLDVEDLLAEVDRIRERGYATHTIDALDTTALSAPVVDPQDDTVGAISINGPSRFIQKEDVRVEYVEDLLETTERINFDLRY